MGGDLDLFDDFALASVSLPALTSVGGHLWIDNDTVLTSFSLPALATLGGALTISNDPVLPQCAATAFKDHLIAVHGYTGSWTFSGNDTGATCP